MYKGAGRYVNRQTSDYRLVARPVRNKFKTKLNRKKQRCKDATGYTPAQTLEWLVRRWERNTGLHRVVLWRSARKLPSSFDGRIAYVELALKALSEAKP